MNLWPDDLFTVEMKAPVTILREQASLLGERTNHIVEAEVQPIHRSSHLGREVALRDYERLEEGTTGKPDFLYEFQIVAPVLNNYTYKLFTIWHSVALYPVYFDLDDDIYDEITGADASALRRHPRDKEIVKAESEEKYLEILARIFRAGKTRHVIGAILSQSQEEPAPFQQT